MAKASTAYPYATPLTVAIRWIEFRTPQGSNACFSPTQMLDALDHYWFPCQIHFELEDSVLVDPEDHQLSNHPNSQLDLHKIRKEFQSDVELIIVVSDQFGKQLRTTKDPREVYSAFGLSFGHASPPGVVADGTLATPEILAHEVGHYFGLPHFNQPGNLMHEKVVHVRHLGAKQCSQARSNILMHMSGILR